MTQGVLEATRSGSDGDGDSVSVTPPVSSSVRYHGLDALRAAAMLAGVFYHLPVMSAMMGGFGMGGFTPSPKAAIDEWLHSFRMPLFFLISGFFAAMMLGKYGPKHYWLRRIWRIGAPLIVALFCFGAIRTYFPSVMQSFGAPVAFPGAMDMPAMPGFPGAGGPPFNFVPPMAPGMNAPGPNPFGPPAQPGMPPQGFMPPPSTAPAGAAFPGFAFQMPDMPVPPSRALADRLFGRYSANFNLEHLWFLWYLLVFVTVAPLFVLLIQRILPLSAADRIDQLGRSILRLHVAPLLLGLLSVPLLIHARGFQGWSLTNPLGFLSPFPDFLYQYHADFPFYFLYFLAGWWLFRLRDRMDDTTRGWQWALVIGIAAFVGSRALFNTYGGGNDAENAGLYRVSGFGLYALGAACTAFGSLGFFQRFLNRPSTVSRYFADTALWIYLIHLPLIPLVMNWTEPSQSPWWLATFAGMVLITAIALALFELIIRPTPLMLIFGPPAQRKKKSVATT